MSDYQDMEESRNFFVLLPGAFAYPFRGRGKFLLIGGAIFFWVARFLSVVPLVGIVIAIFVAGYLCAFMLNVIDSSGKGDRELPNWPDFSDFASDILYPLFLVIGTVALCFLPAIVLLIVPAFSDWETTRLVRIAFVAGLLYLPMGLMAVALRDSLAALNPLLIIPSIVRVPLQYLTACVLLAAVVALRYFAGRFVGGALPLLIGLLIVDFLGLYFLMVEMRILGLIYYGNEKRFRWFYTG